MRIALLSYSTKPRGGVVHTLYLAEALAATGADVTVWSLARGGDEGFFRPVDPRVRLSLVPFPDRPGEGVGTRILRSIAVLRDAFDGSQYDVVHAQDCISANAAGQRPHGHVRASRGESFGQVQRVDDAAAGFGRVAEQRDPHQ